MINDGSTDETSKAARSFLDERIQVIDQFNGGVSAARNMGLELANGAHITFLDADDWMSPNNLQVKLDALHAADVQWVFSDIQRCDKQMKPLGPPEKGTDGDVVRTLLSGRDIGVPLPCGNLLARAGCFKDKLRFDTQLSNSADQDIVLGLAGSYSYKHIPVTLNLYRTVPGSMSKDIALFEKDLLYLFRKAKRLGLLKDAAFRRFAMANAYWSIGGAWWKNAAAPAKALPYFFKALLLRPVLLFRPLRKK